MRAQACNLSYSGGEDWEDLGGAGAVGKVHETLPHLNQ
jgi:hypothetical protein